MDIITQAIEQAQIRQASVIEAKTINRNIVEIDKKDYISLFNIETKTNLLRQNKDQVFIYDEMNKPIIEQLYFWLTGNENFKGNIKTGILLSGSIGTGKTLILDSFLRVYNHFTDKKVRIYDSRKLFYKLVEDDTTVLSNELMFIDDIGKEPLEFIHYGYKKLPMVELLSERHKFGVLTFATTNFKLDGFLLEKYGETITDRFKEMFNILELKGESKR